MKQMAVDLVSCHNRVVDEIAQKYERQGYRVIVEPTQDELPDFLKAFRPDIIASRQDESVVVEVKAGGKSRPADYHELAVLLSHKPGWRFDLAVANGEQAADKESISLEEILALLKEGEDLEQRGRREASLLVTWPAIEAALRLAAEGRGVELPDLFPRTLISRLYSDGVLDERDYQALRQGLMARNAVVHGFREKSLSANLLTHLRAVANHLVDVREIAQ
jgi:uncharacterized protein YutE (UPF0331/DUF86 family)